MANTTNLNLIKPAGTDYALVSVINGNMDIIDSKVGAIPANESAQSQITALNNQMAKQTVSGYTYNENIAPDSFGVQKTAGIVTISGGFTSKTSSPVSFTNGQTIVSNIPAPRTPCIFMALSYDNAGSSRQYRIRIVKNGNVGEIQPFWDNVTIPQQGYGLYFNVSYIEE